MLANMTKPAALMDIDNTLYDGFSYFDILPFFIEHKVLGPNVLEEALLIMKAYKSGQIEYEEAVDTLLNILVEGLKGESHEEVYELAYSFYKNSTKFSTFARPTIELLLDSHQLALVTAEPQFIAQAVGKVLGVSILFSSICEVENGVLTGKVEKSLAMRKGKLGEIAPLLKHKNNSFAFGDSEGDVEMLEAVDFPICVNPTNGLREVAKTKGWYLPENNDVPGLVESLLAR